MDFSAGNGDIVPVTLGGKIFTLMYALYGIPVFMWYIVKLGVLFRSVVARMSTAVVMCGRTYVRKERERHTMIIYIYIL
jgi:hypothetical protein